MVKIFIVWVYFFTILSFSSASSKLDLSDRQFSLKSLSENTLQGHLYQPLKIHTQVVEEFFSDDEVLKVLGSNLDASAKIISNLLLTRPSTGQLRLGEKNQCANILLSHIGQREEIDADIAIFAVSSQEKSEIITSKKCEVIENKYIKAIALEINTEKFIKLEEISKIKELCIAIANVLYGDKEEEKQVLIKEIGESLAKEKKIKQRDSLRACYNSVNNCVVCIDTNNCQTCASGYFLSGGICLPCTPPCASCSGCSNCCSSCEDPTNMSWDGLNCRCTDTNKYFNTTTLVCQCKGNYLPDGDAYIPCAPTCGSCSGSASFCTSCIDGPDMTLYKGTCTCNDPNASLGPGSHFCSCNSGFYIDRSKGSSNLCLPCAAPCDVCLNAATQCATCINPAQMTLKNYTCICNDPNASFNSGSLTCECNAGYFLSSGVCTACGAACTSCLSSGCVNCIDPSITWISGGQCICKDPNAYFSTTTNTCECNIGYFSESGVCQSCEAPCSQCINTPTFCTQCDDPSNMALNSTSGECTCTEPYNSFNTTTLSCQCDGYIYYGGNCAPCTAPCLTCQQAPTYCTSCYDSTHMTLYGSVCACSALNSYFDTVSNTCQCKPGYFSNSGACYQCNAVCSTCSGSADFCTSCKDSAHMTLNLTTGVCTCTDPNAYFNQGSNSCQCYYNYIYTGGVCIPCTPPCQTCDIWSTFCASCYDPNNMYLNTAAGTCRCWDPYASFNQTSLICECIEGYYMSSSGRCQRCIPPCAHCSNSATFCTACDDLENMSLNVTEGTCKCKDPDTHFNPWVLACWEKC